MSAGLIGATITCPDAGAAAALYETALGYQRVDSGAVTPDQARLWQAPALAGAACVRLAPVRLTPPGPPPGLAGPWLRFISQPGPPPAAFTSSGWAALELTVQDCESAVARLAAHGFIVAGPAADLDFADGALCAGQVRGPHGEMLYLTEVRRQVPGYVLPQAAQPIDRLFIAILATPDLEASLAHQASLDLPESGRFQSVVPYIAAAQGLPHDHAFSFATTSIAPGHYLELDSLPGLAPRPRPQGLLPPGIAFITLAGTTEGFHTGPAGESFEILPF
jgi:hypothetical protein